VKIKGENGYGTFVLYAVPGAIPKLFITILIFRCSSHYFLLKGNEHALKEFYPSMVQHPRKSKNCLYLSRSLVIL
jgi:hypothetical protein